MGQDLGFFPVLLEMLARFGSSFIRSPSAFICMCRYMLIFYDGLDVSFRTKWSLVVSVISKGSACVSA